MRSRIAPPPFVAMAEAVIDGAGVVIGGQGGQFPAPDQLEPAQAQGQDRGNAEDGQHQARHPLAEFILMHKNTPRRKHWGRFFCFQVIF
ncbi:MAG: hypothetical protein ACOX2G_04060 [Bacillota bacterium]